MMNMKLWLSTVSLALFSFSNVNVALAALKCTLSGKEVECPAVVELGIGFLFVALQCTLDMKTVAACPAVVGWGISFILLMIVLGFAATVFWVLMLVHAIKHDVESKALWIVLMVFTGIVGALIYYFVVKRDFDKRQTGGGMPPTMPSTMPPTVS